MRVAILDYQAGNLTSVQRALAHLGHASEVTSDARILARAERVIFPGVGAAGSCMANLRSAGLDAALTAIVAAGTPLLCICVGMQLLFERSEEDGGVDCLGLLPGTVRRFRPGDAALKVQYAKFEAPPARKAGIKVKDVTDLVNRLQNEAKVL